MKVSKEDVAGVIGALEHWFQGRDATAEQQRWRDDLDHIVGHVSRVPGVTWHVVQPEGVTLVPRLTISWDMGRYAVDGVTLRRRMLDGTPRVMLDDRWALGNEAGIDPFNFQAGEADEVGRTLAATLV